VNTCEHKETGFVNKDPSKKGAIWKYKEISH